MRRVKYFLDTIQLPAASTDFFLNQGIPNDYGTIGLLLSCSFRNVVAVHATAAPLYGSPFTFLERITVEGNLLGKGKVTLFDMSGRQAMQYAMLTMSQVPYFDPDNFLVGAGAIATYDIRFELPIYFHSPGSGIGSQMATILPANMFSNPLTLRIRRGAATALANNAGGSTQTFTAFGSGAGNPSVNVHRIVVKAGLGAVPAPQVLVTKTRQGPFNTAAAGVDTFVARLNTGNLIGRMMLVNGAQDATTVNEMSAGALITAPNITRLRLKQNQNVLTDPQWDTLHLNSVLERGVDTLHGIYLTGQGLAGGVGQFAPAEMPGLAMLDFIPDGNLDDSLNTVGWSAQGQTLQVNADVTALAAGILEVITEEYMRLT